MPIDKQHLHYDRDQKYRRRRHHQNVLQRHVLLKTKKKSRVEVSFFFQEEVVDGGEDVAVVVGLGFVATLWRFVFGGCSSGRVEISFSFNNVSD